MVANNALLNSKSLINEEEYLCRKTEYIYTIQFLYPVISEDNKKKHKKKYIDFDKSKTSVDCVYSESSHMPSLSCENLFFRKVLMYVITYYDLNFATLFFNLFFFCYAVTKRVF